MPRLDAERIVEFIPNRGARVMGYSATELGNSTMCERCSKHTRPGSPPGVVIDGQN